MLVSLNLIEKFITLPKDAQGNVQSSLIASILTRQGFEVEEIQHVGHHLKTVVIGHIESCQPHPNADKLQICQVSISKEKTTQIVCGAPNARAGLFVAVALPGTKLSDTFEIKPSTIRQIESFGMLCSRAELGLMVLPEVDGDGIWELHKDAQGGTSENSLSLCLGQPVFQVLGLEDVRLDLSITPNRPDVLCHLGVVRELQAGFEYAQIPYELKDFSLKFQTNLNEERIRTDAINNKTTSLKGIEFFADNHLGFPTYFMALEGLSVAPSPGWLRNILENLGINSINNVVDCSNYLLAVHGQPNHVFDFDQIALESQKSKRLVLRHAKPNESFLALDQKERILHEADGVVADHQHVQALLGVVGGEYSKVTTATSTVMIEFANPDPVMIRRSARRHGKKTDASFLFEKGIDTKQRFAAALELHNLLCFVMGKNNLYVSSLHSRNQEQQPMVQHQFEQRNIFYTKEDLPKIIGTPLIPYQQQLDILKSLGFSLKDGPHPESILVGVPSWRTQDVVAVADLVEECIRVVGIDKVPSIPLLSQDIVGIDDPHFAFLEKISSKIASLGYHEVISLHFMRADDHKRLGLNSPNSLGRPVTLINPLSQDEPYLHTTLIPDLLRKVSKNLAYGTNHGQLFHVCRTFQNSTENGQPVFAMGQNEESSNHHLHEYSYSFGYPYSKDTSTLRPVETPRLSGVCFGVKESKSWQNQGPKPWTLHDMLAHLQHIAKFLNVPISISSSCSLHPMEQVLHPGKKAYFSYSNENNEKIPLGWCGEIHPRVLRNYDIDVPCLAFEWNLASLLKATQIPRTIEKRTSSQQKYPTVVRDFAFIFSSDILAKDIQKSVDDACRLFLKEKLQSQLINVKIFDVYTGKGMKEGYKSIAFEVSFQPEGRTLTDKDIQMVCELIVKSVQTHLGGEQRE